MGLIEGVRIRFDHVSIAVNSIDRGVAFFQRYFPTYPRHEKQVSEQASGGFLWQDFYLGGVALEFIEELPGHNGFVTRFIQNHGEGMHHISFEIEHIDPVVTAFKRDGVRIVDEYTLEDGSRTAFISPRSAFGTLIQFWQPVDYDNSASKPRDDRLVRFDHVALAVQDIRRAMEFFGRYFDAKVINEPAPSSSQGDFILAHMDIGGFEIEFLQSSGAGTADDFVGHFIERHGEGLHHFTLNVENFEGILDRLSQDGVRIVGREVNWRGEGQFFISPRAAFGTLIQVWEGLGGEANEGG
jgi:methylmalonyl-CoA/ethylmalonyl-CoA epimerase